MFRAVSNLALDNLGRNQKREKRSEEVSKFVSYLILMHGDHLVSQLVSQNKMCTFTCGLIIYKLLKDPIMHI